MTSPLSFIKAMLVDDEPLALEGLRLRLGDFADIQVVAECRNLREAQAAILIHRPDVVFLDIEMPGQKGIELLNVLPPDKCPWIIFVTAFSRYAINAFDIHALDYLIKPVNMERLADAIGRLRERLANQKLQVEKQHLLSTLDALSGVKATAVEPLLADAKLTIKDAGRTTFILCNTIEWIDAAGDYMCVHAAGTTHILRITMKDLEAQLNPSLFCRIHRSTLVNIKSIASTESLPGGDMQLNLLSGVQLKVSRSFKKQLKIHLR